MNIALAIGRIEHRTGLARSALEVAGHLAAHHCLTLAGPIDVAIAREHAPAADCWEIGLKSYVRPRTLRSLDPASVQANEAAAEATLRQAAEIDERLKQGAFDIIDSWGNWATYQNVATCRFCLAEYLAIAERRDPALVDFRRFDKAQEAVLHLERTRFESAGTKIVVANSRKVARELMRHYRVQAPVVVVYNGVNFSRFDLEEKDAHRRQVRMELDTPEQRMVGVFVSTHAERKNLRLLAEALLLTPVGHNTEFWALGIPTRERRLGVPALRYLDFSETPERYIAAADFLVIPTIYDACCNVVLEAAALGVPVLASDQAGSDELFVRGESIVVHPSEITPQEYADFVHEMVRDPERLRTIGRAAYLAIRARNWSVATDELTHAYRRCLQ